MKKNLIQRLTAAAILIVALSAVDTSCTAQPKCPPGQHVQHARTYSGHTWECVSNVG
jgi:hypothetical protein